MCSKRDSNHRSPETTTWIVIDALTNQATTAGLRLNLQDICVSYRMLKASLYLVDRICQDSNVEEVTAGHVETAFPATVHVEVPGSTSSTR